MLDLACAAIRARHGTPTLGRRAGREIWEQTHGRLSAFVCGAGTGGTIAGVSMYLKSQNPAVQVFLADPPGSSLHNKVTSPCVQLSSNSACFWG